MKCDLCVNKNICKYIDEFNDTSELFKDDKIFELDCKKYQPIATWIAPNYTYTYYPDIPQFINPTYQPIITCNDNNIST